MRFIKHGYIIIGLFLLNIAIKTWYLSTQSISHDEPFTIYHAQFDFFSITHYLKNYNNPPLFELILHFWIKLFGISSFAVRFLPMLFSALAVVYIYKIGLLLFDKKTALLSSLLFTFSTFQIYYAHDCRVYALFLLLTLISLYLFFQLVKNNFLTTLQLVSFIIVNTALIYGHYFGFIVLFIECCMVLCWHLKNRYVIKIIFASFIASALLYLPQLYLVMIHFFDSAKNGTWLKSPHGIESIYNMLWSFCNAPVVTVLVIIVFVAAILLHVVKRKEMPISLSLKYILFWCVFPFVSMFILSYQVPMFLDRYLIFMTPALYILIALCMAALFKNMKAYYVISSLLVISFFISMSMNPSKKRLVNDVVNYIQSHKNSHTLVVICPTDFMTTFAYTYKQDYFKHIEQRSEYQLLDNDLKKDHVFCVNNMSYNSDLFLNQFDTIMYLDAGADFAMPDNQVKSTLNQYFKVLNDSYEDNFFKISTYIK